MQKFNQAPTLCVALEINITNAWRYLEISYSIEMSSNIGWIYSDLPMATIHFNYIECYLF